MLEVQTVEAAYGPFLALSGVTLTVHPGEIVALLGPNGAGKTTLIRCITGLLRPRAGLVRFEGEPLGDVPAHAIVERGIAVVPEGRRLFGAMTVEENLELGAFVPDEPSLGLAPLLVESIFEILREINASGVSILLVEQNVHAALILSRRAYILEAGRVVGEGSAAALLDDARVRRAYLGPLAP